MNLVDKLDEWLLSQNEQRRPNSHHPSSINACIRQQYYKWIVEPKTNPATAGNIIKMKFGDYGEVLVENALELMLDTGEIESYGSQIEFLYAHSEIYTNYKVHGYLDFVIELSGHDMQGDEYRWEEGIEVKTSFGRGIVNIQKTGEPKQEHLEQIYMYMLGTGINIFHLIYIGRDSGYRTVFQCKYNAGKIIYSQNNFVDYKTLEIDEDKIFIKLQYLEKCIKENILPEKEYKVCKVYGEYKDKFVNQSIEYKSDWQCMLCDWRDKCHSDTNNDGKYYGGEKIV